MDPRGKTGLARAAAVWHALWPKNEERCRGRLGDAVVAMRVTERLLLVSIAVAAAAKAKPSEDCIVTSTFADGSTEQRDCYVLDPTSKELQPGTKARFESCTQ